jgi:predicted DNA-binding protein (UPF0251 family)
METKQCKKCKRERRSTQFSLLKGENRGRNDVCRRCNYDGLTAADKHKILREAYRNFLTWRDIITYPEDSEPPYTITYRVPKDKDSNEYVPVTISFVDLARALKSYEGELKSEGTVLSARKEQAFFLNVLRDLRQKDVAEIMGISMVSVGQYVDQGMLKLCKYYFGEEENDLDT